jgi:ClpP class serine protease
VSSLIAASLAQLGERSNSGLRTVSEIAHKRTLPIRHVNGAPVRVGVPIVHHIDIDDAQSVLRAIRETPLGRGIEIILHTPGGLVLAASQIARRRSRITTAQSSPLSPITP